MKAISSYSRAVLALALGLALLPAVQAQFLSSRSECVQDCINSSHDVNCSIIDVACFCRASAGNFLLDLITCMHDKCDRAHDNLLLTPLQFACQLVRAPIPASAIRNALSLENSLATQPPMTKTTTSGGSTATSGAETTTTVKVRSSTVATVTATTTERRTTLSIIFSVTERTTTTESGSASTVIPVATTSLATLNSSGSASKASGTDGISSTTTSTSVEARKTTSSSTAGSKTSSSINPDETDSSPFKLQSVASRNKAAVGRWLGLGLGVLLAVSVFGFRGFVQ